MDKRLRAVLFSIVLILSVTVTAIFIAKGYRINPWNQTVVSTGILVATSDPDGAQVFVDGKLLTATNNTVNLNPGKYQIKITKDGYSEWEKTIEIKREEVYKTNVFLFPRAPDLRPITFNGAKTATVSPDGTRIAYQVASASAMTMGVWVLEMSGRPIIGGADFRHVYKDGASTPLAKISSLLWSPEGNEIAASTSAGLYYLLETDRINDNPPPITLPNELLNKQWKKTENDKFQAQISKLPEKLLTILATSSAGVRFSPDETKILYTATASATLPQIISQYLPGTNQTPQVRKIEMGKIYVYDLKEDRNYLIENYKLIIPPQRDPASAVVENCRWFPTSRHLIVNEGNQISVIEFDGTNRAVIYAGPYNPNFVYPWPNWSKIVILTSLNPANGVGENLYTINLR